jgi:hypothetical protein
MIFLNFIIIPVLLFLLSVFIQRWFDKDEFINYFKIILVGIVAGIIINIIFGIINIFLAGRANHLTVFFKSLFIDGILFTLILSLSFLFVLDFFLDMHIILDWFKGTVFAAAYLGGIFLVTNIVDSFTGNYPASVLIYLSKIPFLCLITLILGFGIPKFMDAYELVEKILYSISTLVIIIICFTIFNYLNFYDYIYQYLFSIPLIIMLFLFKKCAL